MFGKRVDRSWIHRHFVGASKALDVLAKGFAAFRVEVRGMRIHPGNRAPAVFDRQFGFAARVILDEAEMVGLGYAVNLEGRQDVRASDDAGNYRRHPRGTGQTLYSSLKPKSELAPKADSLVFKLRNFGPQLGEPCNESRSLSDS